MRKLLQNRFVVVVLSVAAGWAILNNLGASPQSLFGFGKESDKKTKLESSADNGTRLTARSDETTEKKEETEREEGGNAVDWFSGKLRDPFRRVRDSFDKKPVKAEEALTLLAIWTQPGSRLAYINERIRREGEKIGDFEIVAIDSSEVWIDGPAGRESIRVKDKSSEDPNAKSKGTNGVKQ